MSKIELGVYLRRNPDVAARLPAPDDPRVFNDLPDEIKTAVSQLVNVGAFEHIETNPPRAPNEYRTTPDAYEYAQDVAANRDTHPCGHGGLRNLGDGLYTCTEDTCEATFGRDVAKALFDGE